MFIQRLKNFRTKCFRLAEFWHGRLVKQRVLVLGDSHAAVFLNIYWRFMLPRCALKVVSVGGATASGVDNPNSTTRAFDRYEAALRCQDFAAILITLGEVDTGFVIWYRAQKKGISVDDSFAKTIEAYFKFLQRLKGYGQVCVLSTPLPTIGDQVEAGWGEVANLRKDVTATQLERTNLTLRFNREVQQFCQAVGIDYISLDQESLGADGLVKRVLLHRDPKDHHYPDLEYCRMLRTPITKWVNKSVFGTHG